MSTDTSKSLMEQYLRHQDSLYGYVMTMLPNHADADEVFQETSLVLWEKRSAFEPEGNFVAWSYAIARNVARNFVRKKRNQGPTLNPELFDDLETVRLAAAESLCARSEALQGCLQRLSDRDRTFVMQCYSAQSPLTRIADQLGLSDNALYLKLSRIRKRLSDCIRRTIRVEGAT